MEKTEGTKPIEYEYWITGPQGARFALYPVRNEHTEEDVKRAKRWLHNNHDVVSLQVRWTIPEDTKPQPLKIPDHIIIKNLQTEKGQLESYIFELEDKIKKSQAEATKKEVISKQDKAEFKKDIYIKELLSSIKTLESKVKTYRKDNEQLIIKLHQSKP